MAIKAKCNPNFYNQFNVMTICVNSRGKEVVVVVSPCIFKHTRQVAKNRPLALSLVDPYFQGRCKHVEAVEQGPNLDWNQAIIQPALPASSRDS